MEGVTAAEHPEIEEIKEKLQSYGALGAVMSGSGPAVFGVFADSSRDMRRTRRSFPLRGRLFMPSVSGKQRFGLPYGEAGRFNQLK